MIVRMKHDGINYQQWCCANARKEEIEMDWDDAKGMSQVFTHYDKMMMPPVDGDWSGAHVKKLHVMHVMLPNPVGNDRNVAKSMCRALGVAFNTYVERYNRWMKDFWLDDEDSES